MAFLQFTLIYSKSGFRESFVKNFSEKGMMEGPFIPSHLSDAMLLLNNNLEEEPVILNGASLVCFSHCNSRQLTANDSLLHATLLN